MPNQDMLEMLVGETEIETLFATILGRRCGDPTYVQQRIDSKTRLGDLVAELLGSEEFSARFYKSNNIAHSSRMISDKDYRNPKQLRTSDDQIKNVMLVGSCLMDDWASILERKFENVRFSRIVFNNASVLPEISRTEAEAIDFQVVQVAARSILPEALYFGLKLDDVQGYENLLKTAITRLQQNVDSVLAYADMYGVPSFFLGFVTPQQNPAGRLKDRFSLNNMVFFFEELNRELAKILQQRRNVYYIDFDQIVSTFGKRYFQDDSLVHLNHASVIGGIALGSDNARLEPIASIDDAYAPRKESIIEALFNEVVSCYRSIRGVDAIKLVVFDLDDTLWRGVAAEQDDLDPLMIEGWPIGILEAAAYLWKRGIMLAIVSKNDRDGAIRIWDKLHGSRFSIENFVDLKIGWGPKSDAIEEIIARVNVLPENVLFVDDNPVERSAACASVPGLRTIDANLIHWRRILLWSSELQPAIFTAESSNRTEMMKAQLKRLSSEETLSRSDFLASLKLNIAASKISETAHSRFARVLELINKTNQFNSTGRRWTEKQFEEFFIEGGTVYGFDVSDIHTNYGLTCLIVVRENHIIQMVMSCRVFGMHVEDACIAIVSEDIAEDKRDCLTLDFAPTSKNRLTKDFYSRISSSTSENGYVCMCDAIVRPRHIECILS